MRAPSLLASEGPPAHIKAELVGQMMEVLDWPLTLVQTESLVATGAGEGREVRWLVSSETGGWRYSYVGPETRAFPGGFVEGDWVKDGEDPGTWEPHLDSML